MDAKNVRKCRYYKCKINDGLIEISSDDFVLDGKKYYHKRCYELKKKGSEKTEKEKQQYRRFVDLWHDKIDSNVEYTRLSDAYNDLLKNGETPDYLFFALEYCVDNRLHLHYPAGFHYFTERQEIRDAYGRKKMMEMKKLNPPCVTTNKEPTFSIKQSKPLGFGGIFGKR